MHFRAGRLKLGANAAGEASGDGHTLVVADQIANGRQHAPVATLVSHHWRQGGERGVLQPILLMLEVRKQCIDEWQHLFRRAAADYLQSGVLDPPRFGWVLHRLDCQSEDFRIDHVWFAKQGAEHGPAHTCVLVSQKLHHQIHAHLAASRFPADVAAVDSQRLVSGDVADAVLLMMNVTANLIVGGLRRAMEAAKKRHGGILSQGLGGKILLLAVLSPHGFEREKRIIRLRAPELLWQLVGLGELGARSAGDAEVFAR